jgi:DNA-binding transcriptional MocR family regulator
MWLPELSDKSGPRYKAIADAIAAAVADGELEPGDRLPAQRELAYRLGVTVGTVSRAYSLAERNGLLAGEVGRGTFVRDRQSHAGPDMLLPVSDVTVDLGINMACGPEHGTALRAALARLAEAGGLENLLPYMPLGGHIEHRAAGAGWLTGRGVDVAPEQVVLTNGAQHGLAVALAAAAEPGATVMVESLTYAGVLGTASFVGRRIAGVAMDEDGVLPDALDMTALRTGAKVAVLVPTIHNPTALVMSEARRQAIAEVARRRNLIVIEDDVYGRLPVDSPPPLAAIIPERTIYVSSASKTLAPGLRVGWVVAPPDYVAAIAGAAFAAGSRTEPRKRW